MKNYVKSIFLMAIFLLSVSSYAQQIGVGGSVLYNPQTESFGFGARASFYPNDKLSYVPQISFYPGFNKVNELQLGLGLEYKIIRKNIFFIYLLGHGGYDAWFNYAESPMKDAQKHNWNLEGGAGISGWGCLRPFFEYRYNVKFMETNMQLGVLYIFNCKGSASGRQAGGRSKKGSIFSKKQSCPAYGPR
jgi:hypothetical protein